MKKNKHIRVVLTQISERLGFVQEKRLTLRTVYGPTFYLHIDTFGDRHTLTWTKNGSQKITLDTHPNTLEDQIIELCNLHG